MKTWYKNLREFVAALDDAGELLRIAAPVSPILEITEITDRESKKPGGGKALFFERVEGSDFPVLTNAFGSARRIAMALGCDTLDDLGNRLRATLDQAPPRSFREKLSFIPKALSYARYIPQTKKHPSPPCQEVVITGDDIDLTALPVLHCWPLDGGRFITLPLVFTRGLADGRRNAGMYRMQVYDGRTTGMHWHIHKDGSHHFNEYRKTGKRMEVAVAVGTDPAVTYAATAPMPRGVDEMLLAGFIRQQPVVMVKGVTVDIEVPAEAEFVLEGYVDPAELRREGPFGDHTGYYSLEDDYPVFHLTALTRRKNPIYSATVVGRPPMEDCYLALATERIFLPLLRSIMPEIRDYWMPWEGVFHNIVVVAIDKEYPLHARKVMNGLWGTGQMSFAKSIVVIDDAALLKEGAALLRHILDTVDLRSDVIFTEGILEVLDHSAPQPLFGSKIGIDATARVDGEERRETITAPVGDGEEAVLPLLQAAEGDFLELRTVFPDSGLPLRLLRIRKNEEKPSRCFIEVMETLRPPLPRGICILYDAEICLEDNSLVLWKLFNNVDPSRDILRSGDRIIVDATKKGPGEGHGRPWPDDISMSESVKKRVAARTEELGIG